MHSSSHLLRWPLVLGCLAALIVPAPAAQLVIWSFPAPLSGIASNVSILPTVETVVGSPTLVMLNQTIDPDGKTGAAYTDSLGNPYPADSNGAIAWDDFKGSGTDGEVRMTLNTTGFSDLTLRFDIKENDNPLDFTARLLRVEYSTDGFNFVPVTILPVTNNDTFAAKSVDLSAIAAVENAPTLVLRLSQGGTTDPDELNDSVTIDNIEITGTAAINPNVPTIGVNTAATTPRLSLPATGTGTVSGVIADPTDPAATAGIVFALADPNTGAGTLTLGAVSSNQSVVPNANLAVSGSGADRTLRITPTGVGTAIITVTATDPQNNTAEYTINYAASAASNSPVTSRYHTGASDGSTAIEVNGLMVVGNDEDQVLRVYSRQQSGLPVAAYDFTANLAGAAEADLEASLRVGNRIYWLGSHGNDRDGDVQPSRHVCFSTDVDPDTAALTYVNRYNGMRADLVAWDNANGHGLGAAALGFAAGTAAGVTATDPAGFNIEGATLTANGQVYLAFRAPLRAVAPQSSRALLVPVTNFQAVVDSGVGPMTFGAPVFLNLFGAAIRSISKNRFDEFLILAGAVDEPPPAFSFFLWDGNPANAPTSLSGTLGSIATNSAGSPEAIVNFDGKLFDGATVDVLVDNGSTIHYANGDESKAVVPNWRKFRSDTVSLGSSLPFLFVTTTVDEDNGLTSGAGASLREAIGAAQDNSHIMFGGLLSGQSITLGSPITVTNGVVVDASTLSAGLTITDPGNVNYRLLDVTSGAALTLRGLTFRDGGGTAFTGAGGALRSSAGASVTIEGCTFTGNRSAGGGAIYNELGAGAMTLRNCTLAGNTVTQEGGAIFNHGSSMSLTHCTVVGNSASFAGGISGGIINYLGTLTLTNCIVAGNFSGDVQNHSVTLNLVGTNLVQTPITNTGIMNGTATVAAPQLAPLGNYGGPTPTRPPLLGSPAIDSATTVAGLTTDQRDLPRSVDGDANGTATPDIGAAERTPGDPGIPVVTSNGDQFDGTGTNGTSLREALFLTAPGGAVVFDSAFNSLGISLSAELVLEKDVVIDGSSVAGGITIDGGLGSNRIFSVNSATFVTLRSLTLTGGNGSDQGGAILNFGLLTLERCTLHSNSALSRGGAISNNSVNGYLLMKQCTLTNNSAGLGGAIHNFFYTLLTHCTLSGNTATSRGGGIFTEDQPSGDVLDLTNCVVAQNNAPLGPDVSRADSTVTTNASGVNFIGNVADSGLTAGPTILTGNAQLAALANNGGPTRTMALLPASPARNAATVLAPALTGDQRGFPIAGVPDLGAYERGFNTFAEWSQARLGSVVSFTGDSDNDSHRNGLEYATRTSPTAWNPSPVTLPVSSFWPLPPRFELMSFSFPYQPDATDLRYIVQRSPDLVTWTEIYRADLTNGQSTAVGQVFATKDPTTQTITLFDPDFLTPRCFWRLMVEKP